MIRQYLKVFLFTSFSFGVIFSIIERLFGEHYGLLEYVFKGVFFGFFWSLMMVSYHVETLKGLGVTKFTPDVFKSIQRRSVKSIVGPESLISKLDGDRFFKNMKFFQIGDQIQLKSKTSVSSWGEVIIINPHLLSEHNYSYEISSRSKFLLTLMDGGKGFENCMRLEEILKSSN